MNMSSQDLYNFLIQRSIENYMKYELNYENLELHSILSHFSKVRKIIAKIMFSVNNSLKEDTFCKKEEIENFGQWRNKNCHDLMITPFYGKYNKIINMKLHLQQFTLQSEKSGGIMYKEDAENITLIRKMYSSYNYMRVIQNDIIEGNLSVLYYEDDNDLIKSIEHIYPPSELIEENYLLYRCIFHTESRLHPIIINHINKLILKLLISSNDNKDKMEFLYEIFWFMSQATFFYRGSASISEMVLSVLYNSIMNKDTQNGKLVISYGADVHAIVNDLDSFKLIAKHFIKVENIIDSNPIFKNEFSIEDLTIFYKNIKYKSKPEVKNIISKIIYEKTNLKDAIIVYKATEAETKEVYSAINNLLEEFT